MTTTEPLYTITLEVFACRRPDCERPFVKKVPNQVHCSDRCSNIMAQRAHRDRREAAGLPRRY